MVGWHHRLNGREFEQTLGDSEGQGSLVCFHVHGVAESDKTERLNNDKVFAWVCVGVGAPVDGRLTTECLSYSQSSTILLEGKLPRAAMSVEETVRRPLLEDVLVISGRVLERGPWHLGDGGETVTQAVGNKKTLLAWTVRAIS